MEIDPVLQSALLVGFGFAASEVSSLVKARRDRNAQVEDRNYQAQQLEALRTRARRDEELQACIDVLAESHAIAIRVEGARERAYKAVTRLRLSGNADLALGASKHYVAASTGTPAAYEVSQVAFINDVRSHFAEEPIEAFEEWMNGEVHLDDL